MKPNNGADRSPTEIPAPQLSPEELVEFRLRKSTLDAAKANYQMVEESFGLWVGSVRSKYGLPSMLFDVDLATGRLMARPEPIVHG